MKKIVLTLSIIILIIIIVLTIILVKTKENQNSPEGNEVEEKAIRQNNVNGLELVIDGIPSETIEKINDKETFEQKLKEYAYENNFVDYGKSKFKFIAERQSGNILTLKMQADDYYKTKIIVDINLNENTYQFYNYK